MHDEAEAKGKAIARFRSCNRSRCTRDAHPQSITQNAIQSVYVEENQKCGLHIHGSSSRYRFQNSLKLFFFSQECAVGIGHSFVKEL